MTIVLEVKSKMIESLIVFLIIGPPLMEMSSDIAELLYVRQMAFQMEEETIILSQEKS
jgi:hypothetical protein